MKLTNDIVHRDEIGEQLFVDFVTERLTETKLSMWEKMTKKGTLQLTKAPMYQQESE